AYTPRGIGNDQQGHAMTWRCAMRQRQAAGSGADRRRDRLRTSCGRELTVGRLALGDARRPVGRVFMDLGECPGCATNGWAGLTVPEARQLARALLAQAADA